MSHHATNWAVSQRGISPVAKVLLWQLADRHNPDHGCFPEQDTLARDCEISRATVNRCLLDLERAGLILRVQRTHPVTKKQLPTRYLLAFEDSFAATRATRVREPDTAESRVSNCDTAFEGETEDEAAGRVQMTDTEDGENRVSSEVNSEGGRVSNSGQAVSQIEAEPCLTDETPLKGLTIKLTSKGTGKRAVRAGRELDFKNLWKVFPLRPGSNELAAWDIFEALDDADAVAALKGGERFAQHHRETMKDYVGPAEKSPQNFLPYLSSWLKKQDWIAAATLPIKAPLPAAAAALMDGKITVNKWTHHALFEACEVVRGTGKAPVGKSGAWSFATEVVEEAQRRLSATGRGPP